MFAIKTTYKGPTDTRGSRIVATGNGRRVVCFYDDAVSARDNHQTALICFVTEMIRKHGFTGHTAWIGGELDTETYVWVYPSRP